VINIL